MRIPGRNTSEEIRATAHYYLADRNALEEAVNEVANQSVAGDDGARA